MSIKQKVSYAIVPISDLKRLKDSLIFLNEFIQSHRLTLDKLYLDNLSTVKDTLQNISWDDYKE